MGCVIINWRSFRRTASPRKAFGFTLIEIAVALVVVALVLGSILVPLTAQVGQRKVSDTQRTLDEIKEALGGFAIANGYLPCPAISATNGQEGPRTAWICNPRQGYVPWAALGVSKLDAWGHIFRYSVTPAYTSNSTPFFTLATPRDITIQNLTNLNSIPAVVLSHGKNGYGSVDDQGTVQAIPADWPANYPDENTNATGPGTTFVSRVPQGANPGLVSGGEFDDIVVWLSANILFNRMVAAGRLP